MARDLRYATATLVTVGPFIDILGLALEDAIAEGADEKITFICDGVANAAPTVVLDMVATNASADNDVVDLGTSGYYSLELTAANTNYVGRAVLSITNAAVHCPVFHEFCILTQAEFDAKYSTGNRNADVIAISGDATAADNAELMFDGTGYAGGTTKLGVSLVSIMASALTGTAAQIAAAFTKFFDKASPTGTVNSLPDAVPDAAGGLPVTGTRLTAIPQLPTLALTTGTVLTSGGNNTASSFYTNLAGADNFWNDALILITSGALAGQVKEIGDFSDLNGVVTLTSGQAFTGIPADDVTFTIINR